MSEPASIGLAELIRQVKSELVQSATTPGDGQDDTPLFLVGDIQLDIKVPVSTKGGGGIDVKVLQLNAGVQRDDVHTVTVKLQPVLSREELMNVLRCQGKLDTIQANAGGCLPKASTVSPTFWISAR
jgi:hypothetical protein